jgi:nucleoside phosphorylase
MSLVRVVRRRTVGAAAVVAVAAGVVIANGAGASAPTAAPCTPRVLVVAAMPVELAPLLNATTVEKQVTVEDRNFFVGRLKGNNVVLAMSGIGIVNATETSTLAFKQFRCGTKNGISAVVFSGVSGGKVNIGDVTVVDRWRIKDSTGPWYPTDPTMMAVAKKAAKTVKLEKKAAPGDPACACYNPNLLQPVTMPNQPRVVFGGSGVSADPFNGEQFFCVPGGGDVFGCEPCKAKSRRASDVKPFVTNVRPYIGPSFFISYFNNPSPSGTPYDAEDMETAAVAAVAAKNHTPFLGFRSLSDGNGDPLHLPGFPFQFFYYRQISADNAATMAKAFLQAWAASH